MGFFDFLKGKGQEKEISRSPEDIGSVELPNLKSELERIVSENASRERERSKDLYSKIKEKFREVEKFNNELSKKKFKSGQRMDAPVNMIKDNYVKKTMSSLNAIPKVESFEYREINSFFSGTDKVLKNIRTIPSKQAMLLSRYFKGETSKIIRTLKQIEILKKEMRSVLDGKALWMGGEVNSKTERISGIRAKSRDLESELGSLLDKIKNKEKELESKEKDMKGFVSGKEFRGFENLAGEIRRMEEERSKIEAELREELGGVKRPLKKLEYSLKQEGKDKSILKVAHSPMKVLLEQGDSPLREAMVRLRDIMLKDNEKERVEELITKIENNYISGLRDRYKFLEGEIMDKKEMERKSDIADRKISKERELENLRKEIEDHRKEMEKIKENIENKAKEIENEKRVLEDIILNEINVKVKIL